MPTLNIPGYKGGSAQSSNPQRIEHTAEQRRQEDIQGFVAVIQKKYHENLVSQEEVITFIGCLNELRENNPISTYPSSDVLNKMVGFTENMLKQNVVNSSHIDYMIGLLLDALQNTTPKPQIEPTPPLTEGPVPTLSRGYKK